MKDQLREKLRGNCNVHLIGIQNEGKESSKIMVIEKAESTQIKNCTKL